MANNPPKELAAENAGGSSEKPKRSRDINIREKIRAAVILERLERNALGELEQPMTRDQIKSAETVLKKCIPDLQSIQLSGDSENPIRVQRIERVIIE